jgi:hypothetical protein
MLLFKSFNYGKCSKNGVEVYRKEEGSKSEQTKHGLRNSHMNEIFTLYKYRGLDDFLDIRQGLETTCTTGSKMRAVKA